LSCSASFSLSFRHAWLFTRHFLISVDLCILLSAIYHVLTRRLHLVKTGRAVCYSVWQTLFWFSVRLPLYVSLLSDLADCLVGHVQMGYCRCSMDFLTLHCSRYGGQSPFTISLLSKLMSTRFSIYFDLSPSEKACGIFAWRLVAYLCLLLSERVVTAVIPYST
jgi:hypothetical protein